jgi:hypothetical protein
MNVTSRALILKVKMDKALSILQTCEDARYPDTSKENVIDVKDTVEYNIAGDESCDDGDIQS